MTYSSQRLQELYKLLKNIDIAMLGNDWQSKKLLKELRAKVVAEIKDINVNRTSVDVVK